MYGSARSKSHPLIEFMFYIAWATFAAWWAVAVVRQGSFSWGGRFGAGGVKITSEASPIHFWLVVASAVVAAMFGFALAARTVNRNLRKQSRTGIEENTRPPTG